MTYNQVDNISSAQAPAVVTKFARWMQEEEDYPYDALFSIPHLSPNINWRYGLDDIISEAEGDSCTVSGTAWHDVSTGSNACSVEHQGNAPQVCSEI